MSPTLEFDGRNLLNADYLDDVSVTAASVPDGGKTVSLLAALCSAWLVISILAVLFVFPLMGTFAQQARNSGSIEVIMTFDYPGSGNSTLPQKINERATSLASSSIRAE